MWFVFLGFTASILAYPVNLRLGSLPLLSPDIFPNLPLFGVMFYLWAAALVVLLFTPADEGTAKWERLALVVIAALVYRGFWNIIAPIQGQAMVHATAAKIWQTLGRVARYEGVPYYDWPGASLALSVLSQITGLELLQSIAILAVFIVVVIGIGTYVFLLGALKSSLSACLAALLIVAGDLALIIFYTAGPMAIVFVVLFLALLFQKVRLGNSLRSLLALLLLAGAAITHFHSAMHFFFLALGLWGFGLLRRRQAWPAITSVVTFLIVPLAWILFWGFSGLIQVSQWTWAFLADPFSVAGRLVNVFTIGRANFGESVPLWYSGTRFFWFVLLYAAGGLLLLGSLIRLHRSTPTESRFAAAFSGLVVMNVLGGLTSSRGFAELLRGLTYAPFFTAPFLLLFLHKFKPSVTRAALLSLASATLVVSFPSFLANNYGINDNSSRRIELAAAEWLQSAYGSRQGLRIFGPNATVQEVKFYASDAALVTERGADLFEAWNEESLWQAIDELLARYEAFSRSGKPSFFIYSPKMALVMRRTFSIPVNHPRWGDMVERLSIQNHEIYDNGVVRMYVNRAQWMLGVMESFNVRSRRFPDDQTMATRLDHIVFCSCALSPTIHGHPV